MKTNISPNPSKSQKFFLNFLDLIEKLGNKLPHPFMLFVYLSLFIMLVSWIVSLFDISVMHPSTGEEVSVQNMLSQEGLIFILSSMLANFTGFAPFGLVIVMMFGIGLAQKVGFFETFMRTTILKAPKRFVTYAIILTGVIGNIASDAAHVVIPPLAAMIFYAIGRHPLAGLAVGFAAVSAGFTANILIAGTDALLAGITTEAAKTIDPSIVVTPVDNWFFMSFSVLMLVFVGGWITEKVIEPRLGKYDPAFADEGAIEQPKEVTSIEIQGLKYVAIATVVYIALIGLLIVPSSGILRGDGGTIVPSPFLSNIVPIILVFFILIAIVYGKTVGVIKKTADIPLLMGQAMKDMSGYIVLIFAAAQFIAYFNWTNLSVVIAVNSADVLTNINFTGIGVIILFILLASILNLFITSGSAQWALMAPVFVPLFMLLDYHPAFVQLAYRIGDSSTNIITPTSPYLIMALGFMKRYDLRAGFGTLISLMIPYALGFLAFWIVLFLIWNLIGLPIGPGVESHL